jgi:hypothetical protein
MIKLHAYGAEVLLGEDPPDGPGCANLLLTVRFFASVNICFDAFVSLNATCAGSSLVSAIACGLPCMISILILRSSNGNGEGSVDVYMMAAKH